ncbi:MAG: gamma-glutamylcyclotransferase [Sandaracinaceae bacterium]
MRYFGYGSNLHLEDLRRWCLERGHAPDAIRPIGPAWLPDHEPVYHYRSVARDGGALSVRSRLGRAVPGMLFEVDAAGWRALDAKEGDKYARVERTVLSRGRALAAQTYVVERAHREPALVAPRPAYAALVREGLASHGLPTHQAEAAAASLVIDPFPRSIFVYGTLRRGELRAPLLERHRPRRWTEASIRGALVHLGAYPGLVHGDDTITGELVELDDPAAALTELDEVEDFLGWGEPGSLYLRDVVPVAGTHAWTYRYLGPPGPPIPSGDWRLR